MLKRRQPRKATEGADGLGVLSVPGQAPSEKIFALLGRGFQHNVCPVLFESTNEDGSRTGLLDDVGEIAKLGFAGLTVAEAEAFLRTIPASPDKATAEEIAEAVAEHYRSKAQ
jgi:hypothetical protein